MTVAFLHREKVLLFTSGGRFVFRHGKQLFSVATPGAAPLEQRRRPRAEARDQARAHIPPCLLRSGLLRPSFLTFQVSGLIDTPNFPGFLTSPRRIPQVSGFTPLFPYEISLDTKIDRTWHTAENHRHPESSSGSCKSGHFAIPLLLYSPKQ